MPLKRADRLAILLLMIPVAAFGAVEIFAIVYHRDSLRQRFLTGPRTKAPVERIYKTSKHGYWADVRYRNIVNGREVECHAAVNAGPDPSRFPVGSTIEIAPKSGTCADAASICDQ